MSENSLIPGDIERILGSCYRYRGGVALCIRVYGLMMHLVCIWKMKSIEKNVFHSKLFFYFEEEKVISNYFTIT